MTSIVVWTTRALAALAVFTLLPMGLGLLLFNKGRQDRGVTYLSGLFIELSIFEILYLPFFFKGLSFSLLTAVYFVVVTAASVGGYLLWYKYRPTYTVDRTPLSKSEIVALIVFLLVLIYQLLRVIFGAGTWNIDDGWYLSLANSAVETDEILRYDAISGAAYDYSQHIADNAEYVFSPWSLFWGMTAKLTETDITTLMRTIMPAPFILLFYYVVYRFMRFIYKDSREKAFMALAALAVFFEITGIAMNIGYTWILCYPWMGKGFGPSIICPAVLLLFLLVCEEEDKKRRKLLWVSIFLGSLAGCVTASSCAELTLIGLGAWGLVQIIRRRDLSLIWKLALCVSPSFLMMASHLVL